jgi:hypothetical protein
MRPACDGDGERRANEFDDFSFLVADYFGGERFRLPRVICFR